jgi:Retinoic acid induced 16-like protein
MISLLTPLSLPFRIPLSLSLALSLCVCVADSIEVEREFSQSRIKEHLREMISILRADTDTLSDGMRVDQFDEDSGSCFDYFIQYHVVREFCIRAIKDTPRGFLPLILNFIASILQNVTYPLLPHVSIHKAIANLLFFSLHYESLQLRDCRTLHGVRGVDGSAGLGDRERDQASVAQYQERIGNMSLMSLLSVSQQNSQAVTLTPLILTTQSIDCKTFFRFFPFNFTAVFYYIFLICVSLHLSFSIRYGSN